MKKLISALLVSVTVLCALAGCSGPEPEDTSGSGSVYSTDIRTDAAGGTSSVSSGDTADISSTADTGTDSAESSGSTEPAGTGEATSENAYTAVFPVTDADFKAEITLPPVYTGPDTKVTAYYSFTPTGADGEYGCFIMYPCMMFSQQRYFEICRTVDNGFTWDRIQRELGDVIDMYAIDEDHFLVISGDIQAGYRFYAFDAWGQLEAAQYGSSRWEYGKEVALEYEYLFPRGEFDSGKSENDYQADDSTFYQAVTAYYLEEIDDSSCRIVLEYTNPNGESKRCTAVYDITGVHPEK